MSGFPPQTPKPSILRWCIETFFLVLSVINIAMHFVYGDSTFYLIINILAFAFWTFRWHTNWKTREEWTAWEARINR